MQRVFLFHFHSHDQYGAQHKHLDIRPRTRGWLAKMRQRELVPIEIGRWIEIGLHAQVRTPTYPIQFGHMLSEDKAQVELRITKKAVS